MTRSYFIERHFHKAQFHVDSTVRYKIQAHIMILNPLREKLGCPIIISRKSGYRPREYELTRGRSGKSEHCFAGKGAVDLTCQEDKLQELFELLQESEYTRVCLYPRDNFIHCDLKDVSEKQVFLDMGHGWERLTV